MLPSEKISLRTFTLWRNYRLYLRLSCSLLRVGVIISLVSLALLGSILLAKGQVGNVDQGEGRMKWDEAD